MIRAIVFLSTLASWQSLLLAQSTDPPPLHPAPTTMWDDEAMAGIEVPLANPQGSRSTFRRVLL